MLCFCMSLRLFLCRPYCFQCPFHLAPWEYSTLLSKTQLKCHLLCKGHHPQLPLAKLVTLFCAPTSYVSLGNSIYCPVNIACTNLSSIRAKDYLKLQLFPASASVFPVTNKVLHTYQRFLHASWMNERVHNSLQRINKIKPLQLNIFIWGSYFHGKKPPPSPLSIIVLLEQWMRFRESWICTTMPCFEKTSFLEQGIVSMETLRIITTLLNGVVQIASNDYSRAIRSRLLRLLQH